MIETSVLEPGCAALGARNTEHFSMGFMSLGSHVSQTMVYPWTQSVNRHFPLPWLVSSFLSKGLVVMEDASDIKGDGYSIHLCVGHTN